MTDYIKKWRKRVKAVRPDEVKRLSPLRGFGPFRFKVGKHIYYPFYSADVLKIDITLRGIYQHRRRLDDG